MPTIQVELTYDQFDWLRDNTKNAENLVRRLINDEIHRRSAKESAGLYELASTGSSSRMPAGDIIRLAREYVATCRGLSPSARPTHKYSRGGADIFGMHVPGELRNSDGALPVSFGNGLTLSGITFNTGFDGELDRRWIGFNLRMVDDRRHSVIVKKFDSATDGQCDELAAIFDRKWNENTGAYAINQDEAGA